MFALSRLSTSEVFHCQPWGWSPKAGIPPELRSNKKLRDKFMNDPTTEWNIYSGWEGLNGNLRISRKKADSEENPPHKLHGLVIDFDTKMTEEEVLAGISRLAPLVPNFYERSLSGKCHLVWTFSKPIVISGFPLAEAFLAVAAEKLQPANALAGFDKAFFNPSIYYTNSGEWREIHDRGLSSGLLLGWLIEASEKLDWKGNGYCVPLTVVHDELMKNPDFAGSEWASKDFQLGVQGPTWWIPGSTSPKSAVVKESGMFTYSAHASRNFFSWADLLGFSFVDQFRSNQIGQAVEGIYFDGRAFWRELSRGDWKPWTKDDILHFLRIKRGLSPRTPKGEDHSELDRAYQHIQDHGNVEGAAPFVFRPNGAITVYSKPFLNTHNSRVLQPAPDKVTWGPSGPMPWLSQFFGPPSTVSTSETEARFFQGDVIALDSFISWLAYYYRTAFELNLLSGHNMFVSGPVNIGKTFLNRQIVGELMGGFRIAEDYLMGEDAFGSELFGVAHWVVDDNAVTTSAARQRKWSEMVKRMAANRTFRYHEKFRTAQMVEWMGRVFSTFNADEGSSQIIPDLERSILDKIQLYQTVKRPTVSFLPSHEMNELLTRELPHFARFLLDWSTPEHCVLRRESGDIDWRFGGVKPWHEPALIQTANHSSRTSGFVEILDDWKTDYFSALNEGKRTDDRITTWRGSAFQLRKELCSSSPATQDALRGEGVGDISRLLGQLRAKGYNIGIEDAGDIRYWTLHA